MRNDILGADKNKSKTSCLMIPDDLKKIAKYISSERDISFSSLVREAVYDLIKRKYMSIIQKNSSYKIKFNKLKF
jgi:hypothetical protein